MTDHFPANSPDDEKKNRGLLSRILNYELVKDMFCTECNARVGKDDKTCPKCGETFDEDAPITDTIDKKSNPIKPCMAESVCSVLITLVGGVGGLVAFRILDGPEAGPYGHGKGLALIVVVVAVIAIIFPMVALRSILKYLRIIASAHQK